MRLWVYLLLILLAVIVFIVFFAYKIVPKIIRNRMEKVMMDSLNAENRNSFAGVDLEKLQGTVDSLLKDGDITKDPNLQENMKKVVESLSNEFSKNMKEVKNNHADNLKNHEIAQAEVQLDSMLKNLGKLFADKDSNFNKAFDSLKIEKELKKINKEIEQQINSYDSDIENKTENN